MLEVGKRAKVASSRHDFAQMQCRFVIDELQDTCLPSVYVDASIRLLVNASYRQRCERERLKGTMHSQFVDYHWLRMQPQELRCFRVTEG